MVCPVGGEQPASPGDEWCRVHRERFVPADSAAAPTAPRPTPPAEPRQPTDACWRCDRQVEDLTNPRCTYCSSPLTPPALVLAAPGLLITVEIGHSVGLGREPDFSPYAGAFTGIGNVSRQHATVGVGPDGSAWIRPEPTPNGTFVNGTEIPEKVVHALRNGDRVGLAKDFVAVVRLHPAAGPHR
jgi:hypothetical protein